MHEKTFPSTPFRFAESGYIILLLYRIHSPDRLWHLINRLKYRSFSFTSMVSNRPIMLISLIANLTILPSFFPVYEFPFLSLCLALLTHLSISLSLSFPSAILSIFPFSLTKYLYSTMYAFF